MDFTVILGPKPEDGFTVSVPALLEVVTEGDTGAEAPRHGDGCDPTRPRLPGLQIAGDRPAQSPRDYDRGMKPSGQIFC
jgi:hypothetical protein